VLSQHKFKNFKPSSYQSSPQLCVVMMMMMAEATVPEGHSAIEAVIQLLGIHFINVRTLAPDRFLTAKPDAAFSHGKKSRSLQTADQKEPR